MEKKVKAEAKRARRMERKQGDGTSNPQAAGHPDLDPSDYAAYFPPEPETETESQTPDESDSD